MNLAKNKTGFTIIEVLVAISFLSVGIFAIAKLFPFGLKISQSATEYTLSATLAQEQMEILIAEDYSNIATGNIEVLHHVSIGSFGDVYNFQRETNVSYVDEYLSDSGSDTGLKKIEVIVRWNSNMGTVEQTIFRRLMARR